MSDPLTITQQINLDALVVFNYNYDAADNLTTVTDTVDRELALK